MTVPTHKINILSPKGDKLSVCVTSWLIESTPPPLPASRDICLKLADLHLKSLSAECSTVYLPESLPGDIFLWLLLQLLFNFITEFERQ